MTSGKQLRILLVEDSDSDAALIRLALRIGGIDASIHRVEAREDFVAALTSERWDVVLSDYNLPHFSASEALAILTTFPQDTPFIVVSGVIGEDTAVSLMRLGAHDYLLKDRLARLPAAIEREIDQAEQRKARRRSDTLFQAVLRGSPFPSAVLEPGTGRIVDCTHAFARMFLADAKPSEGGTLFDVVRFSHPERIHQLLRRGSGTTWYTVYFSGDDVARMANVSCYSIDHEGAVYTFVVLEDVTEQHYLKAAFDAIEHAVLIIGSDSRLLYANHSAEQLFGSLYFQMKVESLLEFEGHTEGWWMEGEGAQYERRVDVGEHTYAASSVTFRFAGEASVSAIVTLRSLAEEQQLRELATHDALTGAYNVRFFDSALPDYVAAAEEGTPTALALLDLDYFKPINDELGHAAGDLALKTFVTLVKNELAPTDIFARVGGDEFAIIFAGRTTNEACSILRRIFDELAATPISLERHIRVLSTSCGVAAIRRIDSAAAVKARADRALYSVKRGGRGRYTVAPDTLSDGPAFAAGERQVGAR